MQVAATNSDEVAMKPKSIQILALVDQIVVTAGVEARQKNQILEIDIDPTLAVQADPQLVYSAVSNLIQNALKYTRENGKITVRAEAVGCRNLFTDRTATFASCVPIIF